AAPPEATHAAMTDQGGPGSHALTQSFTIPVDPIASATISFQLFINNQASVFFSPNSLDFNVTPNQQIRVDILTATADVFSVTPGVVLLNLYQSNLSLSSISGTTHIWFDITAFA